MSYLRGCVRLGPVRAEVRYLGPVQGRPGTLLGLAVLEPGWREGDTDGGNLFSCDQDQVCTILKNSGII